MISVQDAPHIGSRPKYAQVTVEGCPCLEIIDTGSDVTIIGGVLKDCNSGEAEEEKFQVARQVSSSLQSVKLYINYQEYCLSHYRDSKKSTIAQH